MYILLGVYIYIYYYIFRCSTNQKLGMQNSVQQQTLGMLPKNPKPTEKKISLLTVGIHQKRFANKTVMRQCTLLPLLVDMMK